MHTALSLVTRCNPMRYDAFISENFCSLYNVSLMSLKSFLLSLSLAHCSFTVYTFFQGHDAGSEQKNALIDI